MKRIVLVASSLAAVAGVGYGGYTQRHLLFGEVEKPAEMAGESQPPDAQQPDVQPPKPIMLAAHEESSSPAGDAHGHDGRDRGSRFAIHDEEVVRGNNEEGGSLPAPNFGAPPMIYPDNIPPAAGGAVPPSNALAQNAPGARSVLVPPSSLPAEARDAEALGAPAPPAAYPDRFAAPVESARAAPTASSVSSGETQNDNEPQTGRFMFGVGAGSDAGVTGPIAGDDQFKASPSQSLGGVSSNPSFDRTPDGDAFNEQPIGSGVARSNVASLPGRPAETVPFSPGSLGGNDGGSAYGDSYAASPTNDIEGAARPGSKTLDGPQTPSVLIEKLAPPEVQIGKPAKFDIKVKNVGQATAENVIVRDEVPQGTRLIDSVPQAKTGEKGSLVWQIGMLRPGEEKTVSMQVMPVGEGEIGSVATVTFSAQASARTTSTRPQLLVECTAPRQVMIGDAVKLNIRLSNPGTGAATRVVLEEDVPDGLVHPAGTALEFEAGTLKPGESRELELTLAAAKAGVVQNVIRARADANLSVESRTDIEIISPALAVDVDGPSKRYLERQASHEVIISNPGTAVAKNVEMVAHLPKGLKFVSANNQGQYDATSHAVYWSLERLNPGDKGKVELTTMPAEAGQQKIRVESKADMDLAAAHEHVVAVEGLAALFFEVADAADPIEVGGETIYEIRVINQGTKTSTNIRVAAALPPGLRPLEAGGATGGMITGQQVAFEPLARLAPKADALFRIRVQGAAKGNQQLRVQLASDEIPNGVVKEESTRVYSDDE